MISLDQERFKCNQESINYIFIQGNFVLYTSKVCIHWVRGNGFILELSHLLGLFFFFPFL